MPFLIRYTHTYVNINRRVDNLSEHSDQGLCSSPRSQSLRLGLTHDSRGAFICDAWTGSFSEARGESARRQGHNMDLAQPFFWITATCVLILFHLRQKQYSCCSPLAPSLELTALPGQHFTRPTTWRRRYGLLVVGLHMGNQWTSSTPSTGTRYTTWTWHGVMGAEI